MNPSAKFELPDLSRVKLVPYFQPILKLDDQRICGYESLGRMMDSAGNISSLGPVFHNLDQNNPEHRELSLYMDSFLQTEALREIASREQLQLFMNIMPHTLSLPEKGKPRATRILERIGESGIDPARIVLEITEDEFSGELSQLVTIVDEFKAAGVLIAVDDAGAGKSDLNRIALIRPDIIKVDLQLLRESIRDVGFRQILQMVSALAHRLGSSLLFEGIEREEELFMALRMGARYLQGFLFSEARKDPQDAGSFTDFLKKVIREHSAFAVAEFVQGFQIKDDLVHALRDAVVGLNLKETSISDSLQENLGRFPHHMSKVAIFDEDGNQISAEFRIENGGWKKDSSGISHNASWRPHFVQAMAQRTYSNLDWHMTEPRYDVKSEFPRIVVCLVLNASRVLVAEVDWLG
ncbi:MAG: EAL domain-containing protein [Spirochaetia bacterium]|nr:EAL domain-containing protein [Spirochaetia bacterium]